MNKQKIVTDRIIKFIVVILGFSIISKIFGANSEVTNFYKDKVVFTPYNIVGVIMLLCALGGEWIGKKKGSILLKIITFFFNVSSLSSFGVNILNFLPEQKNVVVENKVDYGFKWINIIVIIILIIILVGLFIATISFIKQIKIRRILNKKRVKSNFNIYLKKEKEVLEQIKKRQEAEILTAIKAKKEYKIGNKICPTCGGELGGNQNKKNGKWFIGCKNYFTDKKCRFTRDYPEYKRYEKLYCVRDDILLERYAKGQIKIY